MRVVPVVFAPSTTRDSVSTEILERRNVVNVCHFSDARHQNATNSRSQMATAAPIIGGGVNMACPNYRQRSAGVGGVLCKAVNVSRTLTGCAHGMDIVCASTETRLSLVRQPCLGRGSSTVMVTGISRFEENGWPSTTLSWLKFSGVPSLKVNRFTTRMAYETTTARRTWNCGQVSTHQACAYRTWSLGPGRSSTSMEM